LQTTAAELEAIFQTALEAALPPYGAVDARQALPNAELAFLREAGVGLDELAPLDPSVPAPELRTAARAASLLATSLTVAQAAERLGVDPSRVRQRLGNKTMYGIRANGEWRLPLFQFVDDGSGVVPGFGDIVPALVGLYPVDVATWFTTPDPDLVAGEDTPVSPREWLLGGGGEQVLRPLIEELHGIA
jgi:hypothetical protein